MKKILISVSILVLLFSACKKDKPADNNGGHSDVLQFASCAVFKNPVHSADKKFTYSVTLVAVADASGIVTLSVSDANGSNIQTLKTESINLSNGATHNFSFSGDLPVNLLSYFPKELKVLLQFTKSGSSTALSIAGQGCTNPLIIVAKDTLHGRAQGIFVNARYDSLAQDFTIYYLGPNETPVSNLAGNTFSASTEAPSGSDVYINQFANIDIHPNSHFTFFKTLEHYTTTSPEVRSVILIDSLNQTDLSKAYVRYVNVYDAGAKMSLRRDGNTIAQLSGVDFLGHTPFVAVAPGTSTFTFIVDFANASVGSLTGVNLQAGKYYTLYQGGYDDPGFSSKRMTPKVITHN